MSTRGGSRSGGSVRRPRRGAAAAAATAAGAGAAAAGPSSSSARPSTAVPPPSFPTHNSPRTWLITAALSPLAVRLIRRLLPHGDYVVACLPPHEIDHDQRSREFRELIDECKSGRKDREGWKDRIRGIRCDGNMSSCLFAVAEAVRLFNRIDILLCCRSEAVVGTVEELSATPLTQSLARMQFESMFFSQVNFIKAALPVLRKQRVGHIIALTSTCGHLGTPGLAMFSAATWGFEGYCDSLAYEVAPFNIKVTIVQPNLEVQSLTSRLIFAPQMSAYTKPSSAAPNVRTMLTNVLNSNTGTVMPDTRNRGVSASGSTGSLFYPDTEQGDVVYRYPELLPRSANLLVNETIHALIAIGGNENPPSRHIVGPDAAAAVQEKLKTVTEEMEDFIDASLSVDIYDSELKEEAKKTKKSRGKNPDARKPEARNSLNRTG